jgi:hypothetical protein
LHAGAHSDGPALPGAAPESVHIIERRLEETEERLRAWTFLSVFASGLILVLLLVVVPRWINDALDDYFWIPSVVVSAFLAWATLRMHLRFVLIGSLAFAWCVVELMYEPVANEIEKGLQPPPLVWVVNITAIFFVGYQIVRSGWRIFRANAEDKTLLALADPRARAAWFHFFGIHSICRWLATRLRRFVSAGLFVASRFVTSWVIGLVVFLVFGTFWIQLAKALVRSCPELFAGQGPAAYCWGALTGNFTFPIIVFTAIVGLAVGLRFLARHFAVSSLEKLRREDPRAPILFLRSFSDDQIKLPKPRRGLFRRLVQLGEPRPLLDHVVLEEGTPFGPVVALGAPGSSPPFGAARAYATEEDWQSVVGELMAAAQGIVVTIDETPGVRWELGHIGGNRFVAKTLFLLPPRFAQPEQARRVMMQAVIESGADAAAMEALGAFLQSCTRACVGWSIKDRTVEIFTTARVSHVSYQIAVRIFLRLRLRLQPENPPYARARPMAATAGAISSAA